MAGQVIPRKPRSLTVLPSASGPRRILFLDDDPARASAFLAEYPWATWVGTAEECLARLAEPWDEVHLDHDLGGEVNVAHEREDCGMAVVRWLCDQPREHLLAARFIVHTHNPNAACVMQLHLGVMGYEVLVRPFRQGGSRDDPARGRRPLAARIVGWLRHIGGD
jgi:hypothetical protein